MSAPKWLVLTWRLPASSSTARVATWRSLQRLGAVGLTPGAVILPFSEHLLEQLEWIAEDISQRGGDAYVLPVTELPEEEEDDIRRRMKSERKEEYDELKQRAETLSRRLAGTDTNAYERDLAVLQRALARATERDHFASAGRAQAERAIKLAHKRKEG